MWKRLKKWFEEWIKKVFRIRMDDETPKDRPAGIPPDAVPPEKIKCHGVNTAAWKVTKLLKKVYDAGKYVVYDSTANEEWPVKEEVSATCWAGQLQPDGFWHCYPHEYKKPGNDKRGIAWESLYDSAPDWETFDRSKPTLHWEAGLSRDHRRTVEERTNNVIRPGSKKL